MDNFLPVLCWGLAILAALTGWGRLPGHWLRGSVQTDADWLEAPAWGIAVSSLIGGLMNLIGVASRLGVVIFVFTGIVVAGLFVVTPLRSAMTSRHWRSHFADWKWLVLLALPLCALVLRFGSSVVIDTYLPTSAQAEHIYINPQDDGLS
jgi:hypothetical protein